MKYPTTTLIASTAFTAALATGLIIAPEAQAGLGAMSVSTNSGASVLQARRMAKSHAPLVEAQPAPVKTMTGPSAPANPQIDTAVEVMKKAAASGEAVTIVIKPDSTIEISNIVAPAEKSRPPKLADPIQRCLNDQVKAMQPDASNTAGQDQKLIRLRDRFDKAPTTQPEKKEGPFVTQAYLAYHYCIR